MSWQYSDYITYDRGQARLDRLRLHIQEVSDAFVAGSTVDGTTYQPAHLASYLADLRTTELHESQSVGGTLLMRGSVAGY